MPLNPHALSTMKGLTVARPGVRTRRESSWDRTGGNADARPIPAGTSLTLADIQGPGCITHIWFTVAAIDKHYLRSLVLRMWWDGEETPSVEVPLGDFFGLGHGRIRAYQCYPFAVSKGHNEEGGGCSLNCYFQMPFGRSARIAVENQADVAVRAFFWYIDYEAYSQPLPEDTLRFHAQWRRENPTTPVKGYLGPQGINYWSQVSTPNLDGKENYVILDAAGRGQFVGCNISIDNFDTIPDGNTCWWGEGDDMIFIDGDKLPTLNGTGSEDYLCHAWGMQDFAGLYSGVSIWHEVPGSNWGGKFTCYRFHIEDAVVFEKSVKVTIEHGHANLQGNDYASTAYWYQSEPHAAFPALPDRAARLPRPDFALPTRPGPAAESLVTPFISDWLVLGPFASPYQSKDQAKSAKVHGVDFVYPPEKKLSKLGTPAEAKAVYTGAEGQEIRWRKLAPEHMAANGLVDLSKAIGGDWAIAYALTRIYSKKARKAVLWLGSDDGCKVWLNGKELHKFDGGREAIVDNDRLPITLKRGWNVLLVKVEQYEGGWGVIARIEDPKGRPAKPKPKDLGASVD